MNPEMPSHLRGSEGTAGTENQGPTTVTKDVPITLATQDLGPGTAAMNQVRPTRDPRTDPRKLPRNLTDSLLLTEALPMS